MLDQMGRLAEAYGLARAALVGGSLVSRGGHNPLEPAAHGVPVVFGPHMEDFSQVADQLVEAGAALRVADARQLTEVWRGLLDDPDAARAMGRAGRRTAAQHKGSVDRAVETALELLAGGGHA